MTKLPRIIEPCTKHRFRVFLYPIGECMSVSTTLMEQVVSFRYDLLKQEATLLVRDDMHGEATGYITKMIGTSRRIELVVDAFDHGDRRSQRKIFEGAKITGHTSVFDYAESGFAAHTLSFKFDTLRLEPVTNIDAV